MGWQLGHAFADHALSDLSRRWLQRTASFLVFVPHGQSRAEASGSWPHPGRKLEELYVLLKSFSGGFPQTTIFCCV